MKLVEIIQAFEQVVKARHSVRGFLPQGIDPQILKNIFEFLF